MKNEYIQYPFTAIVGQEDMRRALILNVINERIGGVLIKGEKGTAKSTAVRALADVLSLRKQIKDCKFNCCLEDESHWCEECISLVTDNKAVVDKQKMRIVDLPVSATEDRVVGTLDMEHAIKEGEKKFEAGILASANNNILYVDEINLLDDHVVDVMLDAAAMGINTVEREGVSYTHPSRFILVGTMNPEEGDLRPQLLDRFGLVVEVAGERNQQSRVEIIKRRLEFEQNPNGFCEKYEVKQQELMEQIENAKNIISNVSYSDEIIRLIAKISIELEVDGHRADITMLKTAITNAAFEGREEVTRADVLESARLVLPHRMRKRPFEESSLDFSLVEDILSKEVV